eukprot:1639378-Prymnesium_polylepis.1
MEASSTAPRKTRSAQVFGHARSKSAAFYCRTLRQTGGTRDNGRTRCGHRNSRSPRAAWVHARTRGISSA